MRLSLNFFLLVISIICFGQGSDRYEFIGENDKHGFINKDGKIMIPPIYLNVQDFNDGRAFVSKETSQKGYIWICIDSLGNKIFDIADNYPETSFCQGYARISSFEEHWFIDTNGQNIFNKIFKDARGGFKNGYAKVSDEEFKNFYYINLNGERVDSPNFEQDKSDLRENNLISFKENGKYGFKNQNGKLIIKAKFYKVDKFENGICAVIFEEPLILFANDNYFDAIINEKGEIILKQQMHCYMGFEGELIKFYGAPQFGGGIFYINKKGSLVSPHK